MTLRDVLIGAAIAALALAALTLALAIRAVMRRAGRPHVWSGLAFRGILIAGLLAIGVASLTNIPQPDPVNQATPAPQSAVLMLVSGPYRSGGTPVEAVSARDGATQWTWTAPGKVSALIAGSDGLAYVVVGAGVGGPDTLEAVRLVDGKPVWSHNGLDVTANSFVVLDDGRVYTLLTASGNADDVAALDAATGAVIWRAPAPADISVDVSLAATDGVVVLAGCPDTSFSQWRVVALQETTGAVAWRATSGPPPPNQPAFGASPTLTVSRDVVFVVENAGASLSAFDASDGALLWRKKWAAPPLNNLPAYLEETASTDALYTLVEGDYTLVGDSALERLEALDARSGSVRWSARVNIGATVTLQVSGATLLANDSSGNLVALNPNTGAQLWSRSNYIRGSASWLASDLILLETLDNDPNLLDRFSCGLGCSPKTVWLNAINARTGERWWRLRVGPVVRLRSSG